MQPEGTYISLGTFATRADADRGLAIAIADRHRGSWVNPDDGRVRLDDYAARWLVERPGLGQRTRELYEGLLRLHILPTLGKVELSALTSARVRQWHAKLTEAGSPGKPTIAKSYRLLKAIIATALIDDLILKNPCVLKGAGTERTPERPIATIAEVDRLVELAPDHLKALVLLATYTSLRLGELSALTRRNVDVEKRVAHVTASASDVRGGGRIIGEPKTTAGRRKVSIPSAVAGVLAQHLAEWAEPGPAGVVFVGPKGGPLRRGNFNVVWRRLTKEAELEHLRFHDLRHTGNTLAAMTGASTRELMSRMGHASARAALMYQHATEERETLIGSRLNQMIESSRLTLEVRATN